MLFLSRRTWGGGHHVCAVLSDFAAHRESEEDAERDVLERRSGERRREKRRKGGKEITKATWSEGVCRVRWRSRNRLRDRESRGGRATRRACGRKDRA